ncbi:Piwi domain-containing protein [Phlebopus sp. FC_14]|nr:Piwi domain-containing protein [Phlebopus sp. FC_14]
MIRTRLSSIHPNHRLMKCRSVLILEQRAKSSNFAPNYFPVHIQPNTKIYQYSVKINSSKPSTDKKDISRRVKQRIFQLAEETAEWQQAGMKDAVAHDSAEKLVACKVLPEPLMIRVFYYDDGQGPPPPPNALEYTLEITFNYEVDQKILQRCLEGERQSPQDLSSVLAAINLVLAAHPSQTGFKVTRNDENKKPTDQRFFFSTGKSPSLGGGLEAHEGSYLSVRPAHQELMVNVNTSTAAFYQPQGFLDVWDEYKKFTSREGDAEAGFGRQVRVRAGPTNQVRKVLGFAKVNARQHTFKHREFGKVTVEQYYKRKYDIELQHPTLPLLNIGGENYLPAELCKICPDQPFLGELSKGHTASMIKVACKRPDEVADAIVNRCHVELGFQKPGPVMQSFGISVDPNMAVVPGRVLAKPGVAYLKDTPASVDLQASWNLKGLKFAVGARLETWTVLVIRDGNPWEFRDGKQDMGLQEVVDRFRAMCIKSGMEMPNKPEYAEVRLPARQRTDPWRNNAVSAIEREIRDLRPRPSLVLVVLSNSDSAIYGGIKHLCDVMLDMATVCVQCEKLKDPKGQAQYFANVALKVNMKIGGINHTLDERSAEWLKSVPTIVFGMDVTHVGPQGKAGTPSIVAVVASVDEHFAQYPANMTIRKSKTEIDRETDVLKGMFASRLRLYQERNGAKLPERVLLYRDGVSESQFDQVRSYERPLMQAAFEEFGGPNAPYNPKLTIIVCGKRHHTRFFPTEFEHVSSNGNPLPGTVVDRGVTPVYDFDFFLQAHDGLKGTAKPTHYYVVHDENAFKADELQAVTHALSYMFSRATKAVSLVSPAYFADIACERGRCYLRKLLRRSGDGASTMSGGSAGGGGSSGGGQGKGKGKGKGKQRESGDEDGLFKVASEMWGNGVSGQNLRDTMYYL